MILRKKSIFLFTLLALNFSISTSICQNPKPSFGEKIVVGAFHCATKLFPPVRGIEAQIIDKKYLLPEDIQKKITSYATLMVKDENLLTRYKTEIKKILKNFSIYELPNDLFDARFKADPYAKAFASDLNACIFVREGTFKNGIDTKNLGTVLHEIKHIIDDKMTCLGSWINKKILGPKGYFCKNEYDAQKAKIEILHKLKKYDALDEQIIEYVINPLLAETYKTERIYPYFYGDLDTAIKLGYQKRILALTKKETEKALLSMKDELTKEAEQYIKENQCDILPSEILKNVKKQTIEHNLKKVNAFLQQKPAKNWKQRYREYKKLFPTKWEPSIPVIEG